MAAAARINIAFSTQIIDINMWCPAKEIYCKMSGFLYFSVS
ncbi:MAG: tRNA-dihydrouridine synthase [Candidatus Malihini olakiniferum]